MPETGTITKANIGLPLGVCIDDVSQAQQIINQLSQVVGDSITNLQTQITNITEATCEVLAECEFPIPPDFPETDPPTIENIIQTLWDAISECCGQELDCVAVVNGVEPTYASQDVVASATLQANVVTAASVQANVVTSVTIQPNVVTAFNFDVDECIMSVTSESQSSTTGAQTVTTGSQSKTTAIIDYVEDVEVTERQVYVGECP